MWKKFKVKKFPMLIGCMTLLLLVGKVDCYALGQQDCLTSFEQTIEQQTSQDISPGGNIAQDTPTLPPGDPAVEIETYCDTHECDENGTAAGMPFNFDGEKRREGSPYQCERPYDSKELKSGAKKVLKDGVTEATATEDDWYYPDSAYETVQRIEVLRDCAERERAYIEDKLKAWGTCTTAATVTYRGMSWRTTFSSINPAWKKAYVNTSGDSGLPAVYVWNGEADMTPMLLKPYFAMHHIEYLNNYNDKKTKEENHRFDYLIKNFDNPSARFYGEYQFIPIPDAQYSDKRFIYYSHLSSAKTMDRGTNVARRIHYSDDTYVRYFLYNTWWNQFWTDELGVDHCGTTADGQYFQNVNDYFYVGQNPIVKLLFTGAERLTFNSDFVTHYGANFADIENSFTDIEDLKAQFDSLSIYGAVNRGLITIDKPNGKWTWDQHKHKKEITQKYILEPRVSIEKWTICSGECVYDCDDMEVKGSSEDCPLPSCEDTEEGCPCPDGDCPEPPTTITPPITPPGCVGPGCPSPTPTPSGTPGPTTTPTPGECGPVADNYGGNPYDEYGEFEVRLDSNGIPYTAYLGGITSCGQKYYYEQYINASSTLVE